MYVYAVMERPLDRVCDWNDEKIMSLYISEDVAWQQADMLAKSFPNYEYTVQLMEVRT